MERAQFFLLCITLLLCMARTQTNLTTDQSALLALKANITSDPQDLLSNWSTNTSVCNWVGVTCGHVHLRVAALNLSYFGLTGRIPPELGNLSFLVVLRLRNNSFNGTLPVELAGLRRLKLVNFKYNNFMGEIPSWFGSLSSLKALNLYGNRFTGSIPAAIFNLSALQVFDLRNNQLSGSIPREIANLTMLKHLYLDNNNFQEISDEIGSLHQLDLLSMQYNGLKGRVPLVFFNMSSLTILGLSGNSFSGRLPDNICQNLPSIQRLYFSINQFDGPLPSQLWQCKQLLVLSLSVNNFSGSIPRNIGNLTKLQKIYLDFNNLTGTIPHEIGYLQNLEILSLLANSFSGSIPTTLCALTELLSLNLGKNKLTIDTSTPEANIFSCLANLKNLWRLNLSSNPLYATLPVSLKNFSTSLQYLGMSSCNIGGNIPNGIGNLSNLTVLDLGYNQLGGSIPTTMGRLQNLQGLYLTDNKLQGFIPDELCQLNNLVDLVLGGNQLSGSVPSCLGNLTALRTLSLGSNSLTSTVPSAVWGLTYVLHINLSSNSLLGPISADVGNLRVVTNIDLSRNNFSGTIPSNIGSLENLVNLSLANNNLEGPIPSSFGNLGSLELLDLSRNNLSGIIPDSLQALLHLRYLNLSFNKLHGEIPTGGPFKNFSVQSFLSNDGLCGASQLDFRPCRTPVQYSRTASSSMLKYIIPGMLAAMLVLTFIWLFTLHKKGDAEVATEHTLIPELLRKKVTYQEILTATNGFNETNLLGSGGFGSVYKGILSNGIAVAIKVFNLQHEEAFKKFDVESELLSNVCHHNLIKIIGSCNQSHFKALVLDYMPNGSLERLLYSEEYCSLKILERLNIMIDVASALEYLHHGYSIPIVHCDLKPSNILLDNDMVAHVADFGIAKLLGGGDTVTETLTLATVGYMAPEYGIEGIVTRKGDVYSFGIVLMETFTKKKPTDEIFVGEMSLKRWVADSLLSDAVLEVVDGSLLGKDEDHDFVNKRDCLSSIMRLALDCSAESVEERVSMQDAAVTLHKIKNNFLKDIGGV
ncbi:LRR receptor-like serine/threonine-protein kinase GSO1 isoform X2 [Rosa chinensis]|uniref:LRR receptor-like serine/threonine-protein kinase GSO1 isoform X2 n=1 Tax=Rosa chinensis TaxID=74649 RepID=UPI000D094AA4|nr:LRR receptor-like serine/threonine-protein kinase GSO1 isoform X2 [Rosa chinensis]